MAGRAVAPCHRADLLRKIATYTPCRSRSPRRPGMLAVQRHAPAERRAEDDLGVASKQAREEDADSAGRGRAGWIRSVPRSHSSGEPNLPARLTSSVGRDRELAEVRGVLAEHRLVTLTGFGGVGKTRLALEVASGLLDDY